MDLHSANNSEATISPSETRNQSNIEPTASSSATASTSRTLRSSARLKSKDKAKTTPKERDSITDQSSSALPPATKSSSKSKRSKGKGKEIEEERPTKRTRRSSPARILTINEPPKDLKGKKRAAPEPSTDEDQSPEPSAKRPRTRSQSMPKKNRSTTAKGKMAIKSAIAASSSRIEDEDVEMLDAECKQDISETEEHMDEEEDTGNHVDDDDQEHHDESGGDDDDEEEVPPHPPVPSGLDETSAMAIFGDYRQFGSYMMSLSSRLKTMLESIKPSADPTTRLLTLQELSELLSISTEDTLAGSFQVEPFVKELVKILGGTGVNQEDDDDDDRPEQDAALAAALALSAGGAYAGDENLEAQVLACRCLANLMEALPGVAHTVVYHGAIPVLCSKLIEISYIDLAEQTLSTMEKISEEFPSAIVREGGLAALLNYLDFFSIAVQRTALQAASNCCRNVSPDQFEMIRGVWPIIRNCLSYSDQRLVEFASLCIIRVIDSYHRSFADNLEILVDRDLIKAVNMLLLPAGGSPLVATNTYTLLLRALATAARSSAKITLALLEADIVDTLYQILTGVLPSSPEDVSLEQGDGYGGQGFGGGLADMTVMENLAHKPKDQIEEALSLISELMPPLPKDGVFDHKAYTEKALAKMTKAKAKADRAAARQAAQAPLVAAGLILPPDESTPAETTPADGSTPQESEDPLPPSTSTPDRTDLLRSQPEVVGRFMQLTVPILIDVYAASVATGVRVKTLTGLLKAVSFLNADGLKRVLTFVPVASFASSILSSKDHPSLVIGALQLVEYLLIKASTLYKPAFRREGALHELEALGTRELSSSKSKEKADKDASEPPSDSGSAPPTMAGGIPGYKKLSSLSLDPDDAITLRARIIRFKHLSSDDKEDSDNTFDTLRRLVDQISRHEASEKEISDALWAIAELFGSPHTAVSSFELLQSGIIDALLLLTTDTDRIVSLQRRKELLLDALVARKNKVLNGQTPFAIFVKKLQESLTRMESFDVVTVTPGSDDSKRSSPSLLARQLRLRLVADDESGIPRNLHNIVVSIHAIATFQALHDYLRPRVAGILGGGSSLASSRLSGMLSALSAFGRAQAQASGSSEPASQPAAESSSSASTTVARRRSQRLSAKSAATNNDEPSTTLSEAPQAPPAIEPSNPDTAPSETLVDSETHAEFTDEEIDAEVIEDEDGDSESPVNDKTVTLSVADDGSKIEAQTPEGTRVATPNPKEGSSASASLRGSAARGSYAAALKAKPTDWHLEFSMDDHILPLDLTVYGAIHQHEMRKKSGSVPPSLIWQGIYTVKFKKVSGPQPTSDVRMDEPARSRSSSPSLSSLPEDAPHAKILRLLRVLHQLNTLEAERSAFNGEKRKLPESAFVNNKLSAKLTRQLEEPMIVASSCLPDWALDLPQHFPFLFPFATRYNFLQSTSFGYARLILKWQSQQARGQESSRRDDGIGFLGRLQRQKVRISRKHILESAVKVFELYGSSSSVLEVEYFEEVGTGLGPTLEFYSLVSKEFARKDLKVWRDSHHADSGIYVHHPNGLFPAPLNPEDIASDGGQKRTHLFRIIGQFVAKAMLDSRIIDLSFNKVFLKLVLGEAVPLTIATLKLVDVELADSLVKVQHIAAGKSESSGDKLSRKVARVKSASIDDLALDFTIPGYDIELRPGGRDLAVTSDNVDDYVREVLDAIIGTGAMLQARAFREGFSKVFPITDLAAFSADELVMLFGNSDEDWNLETLIEAVKADHGYNIESRAIRDLLEIMSEYDAVTRRNYLQFITGSPKLPINGFRGLNPPLTVVRKPHEAPLTADDYLPSVMTCVNYLKLPEYSSKAAMKEKLRIAMVEGVGSFHLS